MAKSPRPSERSPGVIDILTNPERSPIAYFFLSFFLIGPALGIGVNGLSTLLFEPFCEFLANQFGYSKVVWQLILIVLSFVAVFGLILLFQIPTQLAKLRDRVSSFLKLEVDTLNTTTLTETFPGLITLASPSPKKDGNRVFRPTPTELAIRHHVKDHALKHCYIICTQDSLLEAETVINQIVSEKLASHEIFHFGRNYPLNGATQSDQPLSMFVPNEYADDPNHVCEVVNAIFHDAKTRYGLQDSQIITDYTGATKSFTAGVILACASPNRNLQYISQIDHQMKEINISYKVRPIKVNSNDNTPLVATSQPF